MEEKKNVKWVKPLGNAVNMGTTMAMCVVIGYFAGRWIDGKLGTEPWIALAGFILGVVAGLKSMWDVVNPKKKNKSKPYDANNRNKNE